MASTGNWYKYGWCTPVSAPIGTVGLVNGSAGMTLSNSTDWGTIQNGDIILVDVGGYGYYIAMPVSSGGGTQNQTSVYTFTGTSNSYPFYYSLYPRSMGEIVKVGKICECPTDVIGMPGQRWTGTLVFDMEGTVMRFNIEGFYEDTAANISSWMRNNEQYMDSNRFIALPQFMWMECEEIYSAPRAYPVQFSKWSHDWTNVKGKLRVTFKLEAIVRNVTGY
jgi:hypothetical protein